MRTKGLAHGYTTGACAAAAAKGAAQLLRDQHPAEEVEVILPGGEAVKFRLHGQEFSPFAARCYVVKNAGDDPDVTNGAEIHAEIVLEKFTAPRRPELIIEGGQGVGRVTKPGLAVPVGEWAINPMPRLMIRHAVNEVFAVRLPLDRRITISIPNGEELAKKTLNSRLGIVGGLSILGTTGIVTPISTQAWTATIDTAIDVARAAGSAAVVLSTGRTSEEAAARFLAETTDLHLPEEAYVMMGDHVAHALGSAVERGVRRLVLAGQFAKLLKIACRNGQTHADSAKLDLKVLAGWVREELGDDLLAGAVAAANTAREVVEAHGDTTGVVPLVCRRAKEFARELAPGTDVHMLLVGYDRGVKFFG